MAEVTDKRAHELFSREPEPTTTRDKILFKAIDLFYTHGIHAVGLDQIIRDVGVTRTTFYNHFESKDDLAAECVARKHAWEFEILTRQVQERADYDPKAMLLGMFDLLDEMFMHPDYIGCIYLNACAEFPAENDPVHIAGAQHYKDTGWSIRQMATGRGREESGCVCQAMGDAH